MTPDPSAVPITVWIGGLGAAAVDDFRLVLFAVVVGFFVMALLLSGLLVSAGLRR